MGEVNPIRTLGDYSKPSHEGYRNTIELPEGNNVVPLRSDTIRLVQNGCSFHGLLSEDPNQHFKDFLKLVNSLDLNGDNRERTRLRLVSNFMASQDARLSKFKADFKQQQSEMTNKIDTVLKAITDQIAGALPSDTNDDSRKEGPEDEGSAMIKGLEVEYFDTFPTRSKLEYHRFINGTDEIAYKMSHKTEQYNSLSDLEKEHTKSVYLRNGEDKMRGVEYIMSKILRFYKECLELRPEYLIGVADDDEVT
ncbi:hypothetical protein Tco_1028337 [Tanacetum coccineum]|uniref:MAK10-like protein n=1 Tax=Tanacetum coccineum TaxID=301880 RepID=A0ABQ5G0C0_9ASTR